MLKQAEEICLVSSVLRGDLIQIAAFPAGPRVLQKSGDTITFRHPKLRHFIQDSTANHGLIFLTRKFNSMQAITYYFFIAPFQQ